MLFKSSAPSWVTGHLCPAIGVLLNQCMYTFPYPNIAQAFKKMDLGQVNTIPSLVLIFSSIGWTTYSFIKKDYYIFFSAIFGISAGAYYSVMAIIILAHNNEIKAATDHTHCIITTCLFWSVIGIIVGITLTNNSTQTYYSSLIVGFICDFASITYYAAPLSTLVKVIRTHDSSSLHLPSIILNTTNNLMWTIYGLIAVNNPLVWGPSAIGLVLCTLQLIVIFLFHAKAAAVHVSNLSENISGKSLESRIERARSHSLSTYKGLNDDNHVIGSFKAHQCLDTPIKDVLIGSFKVYNSTLIEGNEVFIFDDNHLPQTKSSTPFTEESSNHLDFSPRGSVSCVADSQV